MPRPTMLLAILAVVAALTPHPARAQEDGPLDPSLADGVTNAVVADPFETITDFVAASENHRILSLLLAAAEIDLSDVNQRITLLAPTDRAFATLVSRFTGAQEDSSDPQALADAVLAQLGTLSGAGVRNPSSILQYHAIPDLLSYRQLRNQGTVETLAGPALRFTREGIVDRDGGDLAIPNGRDNLNQNGWVHSVTKVLIPFNLTRTLERRGTRRPGTAAPPVTTAMETAATEATTTEATTTEATTTVTAATVTAATVTTATEATTTASTATDAAATEPVTAPTDESANETDTPEPSSEDDGVCFPATARVHVPDGASIAMADLTAGTHVLHDGAGGSSKVFLFTHRKAEYTGKFIRVETACRHAVTLTKNHYLYANGELTAASAVRVGDVMKTVHGPCAVSRVSVVQGVGLYAPHSLHGDLVVDGIVVSGYSRAVSPGLAHALLLPVRWVVRATGVKEPLGQAFYNGADWALRFLPRGNDAY